MAGVILEKAAFLDYKALRKIIQMYTNRLFLLFCFGGFF
jgi:hypothetical protein